jgi:hypothetical protein
MERMGKGLAWNGVSADWVPIVFLPQTISGNWPSAVSTNALDSSYEIIGPQVFRFEYCYLATDGSLSITPPSVSAMAAIIVDIAVIDYKSRVLLNNTQINQLAGQLVDYSGANLVAGQLRTTWQNTLNTNPSLPRPALSGIRLYERCFYLSPPTL